MTEEYCLNNSISHTGLKQTDETREKRSNTMKGKVPKNIDLLHSPEIAKKRGALLRGENNGSSKLTEEIVLELRARYRLGHTTAKQLAELFKINEWTIYDVLKRKTWKHI